MTIDYISDLHVDFYLDMVNNTIEYFKEQKINEIFKEKKGEVLIIAGDIGHFNKQNYFVLKTIQKLFDYKKIFFVLGNHDYYLLSHSIANEYDFNSFNRINEMQELTQIEEDIHLLTGHIVEYKGIRFGGTGMWYDGRYLKQLDITMNEEKVNSLWKNCMRDSDLIYGIRSYKDILGEELIKLQNIYKDSDVLISHINPSINHNHTHRKYILNKMNGFYSFDGEWFLENTLAKYWVFGHTHKNIEYEVYGTKVVCNPLGYPHENIDFELKSFEI